MHIEMRLHLVPKLSAHFSILDREAAVENGIDYHDFTLKHSLSY